MPRLRIVLLFLVCLLTGAESAAQTAKLDSLRRVINTARNDSVRIAAMVQLGSAMKSSETVRIYRAALRFAQNRDYKKGMAVAQAKLGYYYMFDSVDFPLATYYTTSALKLAILENALPTEASCYQQLGIITYEFQDYRTAQDYFQKSRSINKKLQNMRALRTNFTMLGVTHKELGELDSAMYYFRQAELLSQTYKLNVAVVRVNICLCYLDINRLDSAERYIALTDQAYNAAQNPFGKHWVSFLKGRLELKRSKPRQALECILSAYDYATRSSTELKKEMMPYLVEAYRLTGNYKLAYEKLEEMNRLNQEVNGTKKTSRFMALIRKFEDEQMAEIQKLKQEKLADQHKAEIRDRNRIIWGAVTLLIISSAFGIFIYRGYRHKQQANLEIRAQKKLIEEKQKEILDSIYYAKRIQKAQITSEKYISRKLSELRRR